MIIYLPASNLYVARYSLRDRKIKLRLFFFPWQFLKKLQPNNLGRDKYIIYFMVPVEKIDVKENLDFAY